MYTKSNNMYTKSNKMYAKSNNMYAKSNNLYAKSKNLYAKSNNMYAKSNTMYAKSNNMYVCQMMSSLVYCVKWNYVVILTFRCLFRFLYHVIKIFLHLACLLCIFINSFDKSLYKMTISKACNVLYRLFFLSCVFF